MSIVKAKADATGVRGEQTRKSLFSRLHASCGEERNEIGLIHRLASIACTTAPQNSTWYARIQSGDSLKTIRLRLALDRQGNFDSNSASNAFPNVESKDVEPKDVEPISLETNQVKQIVQQPTAKVEPDELETDMVWNWLPISQIQTGMIGLLTSSPKKSSSATLEAMRLAATFWQLWRSTRFNERLVAKSQINDEALRLIETAYEDVAIDEAGQNTANVLHDRLGAAIVALSVGDRPGRSTGDLCVNWISNAKSIDRESRLVQAISRLVRKTINLGETQWWDLETANESDEHEPAVTIAETTRCRQLVCHPLFNDLGNVVGVITAGWDEEHNAPTDRKQFQSDLDRRCRHALTVIQVRHAATKVARPTGWFSRFSRTTKCIAAVAIVAILVVGAWPVPYSIDCNTVAQPVKRRFVAAPFDATLKQSLVAPGDSVREGDTLAIIDERDLQLELDRLQAELQTVTKERDTALAQLDTPTKQIAELEMRRLEIQIEQLLKKIAALDVKAPIDGLVVTGDLEKSEQAPIQIGQTLFEIAPLNQMSIEIEIPEEEVSMVRDRDRTTIRFDAYPRQVWEQELGRIQPRSEQRGESHVFIAEIILSNEGERIRPGMHGTAKIHGPTRPLAWSYLRKPYYRLTRALGW